MPDWSYRTVFRPLLFRMPPQTARDLALGAMGTLARIPGGSKVIDFLGHLQPDDRLRRTVLGMRFLGPVGLACDLDMNVSGLGALARLGFGFVEVGPVTALPGGGAIQRRIDDRALVYPDPPPNPGAEAICERLRRWGKLPLPVLARVADAEVAAKLAEFADALVLTGAAGNDVTAIKKIAPAKPLFLAITPDLSDEKVEAAVESAFRDGVSGIIIDSALRTQDGWLTGLPALESVTRLVRRIRQRWGDRMVLIAAGVHEPEHALQLRMAGADLVQISTGLWYSGPGLPKRINDAWLYAQQPAAAASRIERPAEMTWFWTLLMGLGMLLGGIMALVIASTRVVLPYDEVFSGMSRSQLNDINPRLLAFMAHDRVSLAGTMIAIGVLYPLLSWFGIRRGQHWAKVAVITSAFAGFGTFFLFLGFEYFDPFHAFVTVVLFQFLLLGLHSKTTKPEPTEANLREDWRWRWCQWGQLLFIIHSGGLIGAGCMISFIGMTEVFVHEDLDFMQTTAETLRLANPRLVPLVAHDRASFGGMLIASGIAMLLTSLWGFRQGERWLWWTMLLAALPAYFAAIAVHFAVGYTNLLHLTPAFAGMFLFAAALGFTYPYLHQANDSAWKEYGK